MKVVSLPSAQNGHQTVDAAAFRTVLGRFVTGVTVITTKAPDGAAAGVTVSSFNTLSLDPPLVLWSLALRAPSLKTFRVAERFAVNILAQNQSTIALQFAKPAPDKFRDVPLEFGLGGIPLITGAAAQLECTFEKRYPGGDHELVIGRVVRAHAFDHKPLVYGQGQFGDFSISKSEGTART
jgi:flavin reductase (DIM6/NTAB) family NADH-FMN oxidoreductase RutF